MNECNIIKDLMPLYAEDLLTADSVEFIQRHIAWCPVCRDVISKCREPLPSLDTINPESEKTTVKKALRRERLRTVGTTLLSILLILALGGASILYSFYQWGYLDPIESSHPAPDGMRILELVERDYIGNRSAGYFIRFNFNAAEGKSSGLNRYYTDWDTIVPHWADDSVHLFLDVTTMDGVQEIYVLDTTVQMTQGGTWNIPGLTEDLCPSILSAAEKLLGQTMVKVTFTDWEHDCQTLVLEVYNQFGTAAYIRYHYPTGTIVP